MTRQKRPSLQEIQNSKSGKAKQLKLKKNEWLSEILQPAMILFLVGFIVTAILAAVYQIANPLILAREASEKMLSLQKVLPKAESFEDEMTASALTNMGITIPNTVVSAYRGVSGNDLSGYAVSVQPKGYGGKINMIVGIASDGSVSGVTIISMNETPGLGTKATESEFIDQYQGILPSDTLQVVKQGVSSKGDIQALTGATVTSRAVTRGVSDAITIAQELIEKEGM